MAPHGVLNTYVNHACRRSSCSASSGEFGRDRARQRAYGRLQELVPVETETVTARIAWRSTHGVGWEQAPHLAKVGRTAIEQVIYSTGHRRGVTRRVAAAVLYVFPALDDLSGGALIPAVGTRRRLRGLMVLGWSLTEIGRSCAASALGRCLTRDMVTACVARAVRGFCDAHWNRFPTATPYPQAVIDRILARARQGGWLPPLAWDEDTIDDPDLPAPLTATRPPSTRTRIYVEDLAELAVQGATWSERGSRVGACRNSIEVALTRAGRSELIGRITSIRWVAA